MVLSLKNGLIGYQNEKLNKENPELADPRGKTILRYFPEIGGSILNPIFMNSNNKGSHIQAFACYIYQAISITTVLYVEIVDYMGKYFDDQNQTTDD